MMGLLVQSVHNELESLMKNHVRLLVEGRVEDLPETCREAMQAAIDSTAGNDGLTVILALSYSGRVELARAAQSIARKVQDGQLSPEDVQPDTVTRHLYLPNVPDPDILIRTGGETRISNFLLWQLAYTELFFIPTMWPDFRKEHLREIVTQFQSRERRFGKTGEQVREH